MISLVEALYELPTSRLRSIVEAYQIEPKKLALIPDKRSLALLLSVEIGKPQSANKTLLRCNVRELRLLQVIVSLNTGKSLVTMREIIQFEGGAEIATYVQQAMRGLESLGLAFQVGQDVLLHPYIQNYVPTSMSDKYTLSRCLNNCDAVGVKQIASNLKAPTGSKASNVEAARQKLLNDDFLLALVESLEPETKLVLGHIINAGGSATTEEIIRGVLKNARDHFFRYDWENRWKTGRELNAVDQLLGKGLLYTVSYGYGYQVVLLIPGDVLRILSGVSTKLFWTNPIPLPLPLPEPPPYQTRHTTFRRDVVALLGFIATQEAVRTNTGHVHKTALKNLGRTLSISNERYVLFLYSVCRSAGLIHAVTERLVYSITPKGDQWLSELPIEQNSILFQAWNTGTLWSEMFSTPLQKATEYRHAEPIAGMRHIALQLLQKSPSDTFMDITSFNHSLAFHSPLLLNQNSGSGGELVANPGVFFRNLVVECLYWLGMAEIGWNQLPIPQEKLAPEPLKLAAKRAQITISPPISENKREAESIACRLTPLGAYLLEAPNSSPPPDAPQEEKFLIQANAEIFVTPFLELKTLYKLLIMTEIPAKGATENTVSLTKDAIRRALDQGLSIENITDFLKNHARTGLPQNVEYLLQEVGSKHGHIHVGKAQLYIKVDSTLLMKELQARRELKDIEIRLLSDTVAILQTEDQDKLLRDLRKAGYLPVSDNAQRRAAWPKDTSTPALDANDKTRPKARKNLSNVDSLVDWKRIAIEDRARIEPSQGDLKIMDMDIQPGDAIKDKVNIRTLLQQAIRTHHIVHLAYQGSYDSEPLPRLFEPHKLMGNFVGGYCSSDGETTTLNINKIQWARLTGDFFI